MKQFVANSWIDELPVLTGEKLEATHWSVAFARAARLTKARRKNNRKVSTIKIHVVTV